MKEKEKHKAKELRKQGISLNEISNRLGISKSSASIWTRDIHLSREQQEKLYERNPFMLKSNGWKKKSENYREKRRQYQELGRRDARKRDLLHAKGCMLFWAEGSKTKNAIIFVNSDPDMMVLFIEFLSKSIKIKSEEIRVSVNCHLGNGLTVNQIENYWLKLLGLPRSCLNKTTINRVSKYSKKLKKNKLIHGVCRIVVHNTEKAQRLFGAIKEYAHIRNDKWLF